MRVAIRADASTDIGVGHVMRCLALAEALAHLGSEVSFVCRQLEGSLCDFIEARGWSVFRLPASAPDWRQDVDATAAVLDRARTKWDWMVVDHYGLDRQWEAAVRSFAREVMAIDDAPSREHDCDLLVDQNLSLRSGERYTGLVPPHCRLLLGPEYAILRPQFLRARARLRPRTGALRRLLVFFGGSDPHNETLKALQGLRQIKGPGMALDVVVGSSNPHRQELEAVCQETPETTYHCQVENMAQLMVRADLAVGGGGVTTLERCCVGLPSLVAILARNQLEPTVAAASRGAIVNLGQAEQLGPSDYRSAVQAMTAKELLRMQEFALALVDGGGCERVAEALASS